MIKGRMINLNYSAKRKFEPWQKFIREERIKEVICGHFNTTLEKMSVKDRSKEICYSRQVMMFFLTKYTKLSLRSIGDMIGGLDHTTVLHACQKIKDLMDTEDNVFLEIQEISDKILGMHVRVTTPESLVSLAAEAIRVLNNLRHSEKIWEEMGGLQARALKKRWQDISDDFLQRISGEKFEHNENTLRVVLTIDNLNTENEKSSSL